MTTEDPGIDHLGADLREYGIENLGESDSVQVADETGDLKRVNAPSGCSASMPRHGVGSLRGVEHLTSSSCAGDVGRQLGRIVRILREASETHLELGSTRMQLGNRHRRVAEHDRGISAASGPTHLSSWSSTRRTPTSGYRPRRSLPFAPTGTTRTSGYIVTTLLDGAQDPHVGGGFQALCLPTDLGACCGWVGVRVERHRADGRACEGPPGARDGDQPGGP